MTDDKIRAVDTGVTCLHPGGIRPRADLVFVHGLGGHPQTTWSTEPRQPKASAEHGPTIFKRIAKKLRSKKGSADSRNGESIPSQYLATEGNPRADGDATGDDVSMPGASRSPAITDVFWPRDLLPIDIKDVRVLTFGYYSRPGDSSQDNLHTLSNKLLVSLENERTHAPNRPIIFVAHNIGGIITKYALKISRDSTGINSGLRSIRDSTRGVIFFGTPHSGSDMASWGEMLRRIASVFVVTNPTLLAALNTENDNGQLEELRRNFDKMLGPSSEGKFTVFSFRETKPLLNGPVGPAARLVIPLASSDIVSEWAGDLTVSRNHRDICRFGGHDDTEYRHFIQILRNRFLNTVELENYSRPVVQENDSKRKRHLLQKLYTCPYRDRKDRNPLRVEGTCEWFTSHPLFQSWEQSSEASFLWVSADPGCGKSVLARYLADDVLRSTSKRTTCYFFFRDDFDDQKLSTSALCAILRQLFRQQPATLTNQILTSFEEGGELFLKSFRDLWDMLIYAAASYRGGEIVCILDALDECEQSGRRQFIEAISSFYSSTTTSTPALKILLTSRPYLDIYRGFRNLERRLGPTIHLSGENQEEVDKIACEINMVIKSRVEDSGSMLDLSQEEQEILQEELTRSQNRTYLWVHLVLDDIQNSILHTPASIRTMVRELPKTVDEAFDKILSKSRDTSLAKRLLSIVIAAKTPLSLQEMALALAIRPIHRPFDDLELVPEARFKQDVRELCGLFVVVVDSKIHLLHQTAREFLLSPPSPGLPPPSAGSTTSQWRFQFDLEECNCILAEIYMWRLCFSDSDSASLPQVGEQGPYIATQHSSRIFGAILE